MGVDVNIMEDSELLLLLSNGDRSAFDALYAKHWKNVFNAAYKRLKDEGVAKDVTQDVFIQLWTRKSKSPIENIGAYLAVSARNSVFKHMEKAAKYTSLADCLIEPESHSGHADGTILHNEFLKGFQEILKTLTPQQQMIFNMKFNEGLSSQQIADELQISIKTVRNQMGRALQTLREALFVFSIIFSLYNR
jgi:RNA polymerase sigma-70 factor (ECF subfamily)